MNRNFSDPHEPYAGLRRAFVYKEKPSHTPLHLARHRTQPQACSPARHLAQAGVLRRTDRGSRHHAHDRAGVRLWQARTVTLGTLAVEC
jgi:hypothetical protein